MNQQRNDLLADLNLIADRTMPASWLGRLISSLPLPARKQQAMVHPCVIDGKQTLVYERGLAKADAAAFSLIQSFAISHGFQLKEDQRADFLEGIKRVKNRRCSNAVSVMILTAGLISQSAYAKSSNHQSSDQVHAETTGQYQLDEVADFDFDAYHTEDELMSGLLSWINAHSSFSFDIHNIPKVKKVSARDMAKVAFGGRLPAAIDAKSLRIFGLYNFNEETVYLLDSINLDSKEGKGILLHELVHYLQYQTGLDHNARCKNELESLAYVLEARFLESQHHRHNITRSHINKVSQCRV